MLHHLPPWPRPWPPSVQRFGWQPPHLLPRPSLPPPPPQTPLKAPLHLEDPHPHLGPGPVKCWRRGQGQRDFRSRHAAQAPLKAMPRYPTRRPPWSGPQAPGVSLIFQADRPPAARSTQAATPTPQEEHASRQETPGVAFPHYQKPEAARPVGRNMTSNTCGKRSPMNSLCNFLPPQFWQKLGPEEIAQKTPLSASSSTGSCAKLSLRWIAARQMSALGSVRHQNHPCRLSDDQKENKREERQ